jgi:imidazolonepropionase
MQVDRLWRNARIATLDSRRSGVGLIEQGAVAVSDGRVAYVGKAADLPAGMQSAVETDLEGRLLTPGLIDCHTHLVFAGDRSDEFVLRLAGADYQTIAQGGGGIQSTVRATRAASEAQLIASAEERLLLFLAEGVTTLEIKSGYGLDLASELKMLRAARSLGRRHHLHICTTLLAAHTMPADQDRQAYLDLITREIIPQAAAAGLADAVDGYCERIGFSAAELRQVFASAKAHGLAVKVHADQLSDAGGAALAAECSALSADHLEWSNPAGIAALARAGTVAVLLPGAFFTLRERQLPPVNELRRAGVRIAVATDCNPGTSPLLSLLTAMSMAAVQFGLTVEETLAAVTREAAHALGLQQEVGTLEVGKRADLAIWNVERPAELIYWMGRNRLHARIWRGQG